MHQYDIWYSNKRKNIWENLHAPSIMLYFGFQLGICRLAFQVRKKRWKCMKYASTLLFPKGSTCNLTCSILSHILPTLGPATIAKWRWRCWQQTNSNQKSHTHLLDGSKEVHATKRKGFWKAFRHLACTWILHAVASPDIILKPSKTRAFLQWFFPSTSCASCASPVVCVRARCLDALGVVVHDLRIRHSRRSSANLSHAVEGHVLLAWLLSQKLVSTVGV